MEISARVVNKWREPEVLLSTEGREQSLQVPPKQEGSGSSVNGGELVFLALATAFAARIKEQSALAKNMHIQNIQPGSSARF
jgi:hypothetical protein